MGRVGEVGGGVWRDGESPEVELVELDLEIVYVACFALCHDPHLYPPLHRLHGEVLPEGKASLVFHHGLIHAHIPIDLIEGLELKQEYYLDYLLT